MTNKNSFKINDLEFFGMVGKFLASVLARKNRLKSKRCHAWHKWQGKMAWRGFKQARKEKRECNWNVNKPYRNVNQKVTKSAKRLAMRQFMHSSIQSHYYYIYYIIFYIIYYRVTDFHLLSAVFRPLSCYSVLLHVNCFANVAPLYGHGEVMGGELTALTELFLVLFKCKQIETF